MSEPEPGSTERETDRIEAFSDGVFAIAITLLLDIKVPHESSGSLLSMLFNLWPAYFAYILSFMMIGIYWSNHHYVFKLYQKTNHSLNLLNLRCSASTCSTKPIKRRLSPCTPRACCSPRLRGC
jgi:uncharacterized membrane protein